MASRDVVAVRVSWWDPTSREWFARDVVVDGDQSESKEFWRRWTARLRRELGIPARATMTVTEIDWPRTR